MSQQVKPLLLQLLPVQHHHAVSSGLFSSVLHQSCATRVQHACLTCSTFTQVPKPASFDIYMPLHLLRCPCMRARRACCELSIRVYVHRERCDLSMRVSVCVHRACCESSICVCVCAQGMLDTILEVSFTADQKHLVAAGGDQALRMWDIASGRVRHTLTGHTGKVPLWLTCLFCRVCLFA